jgi:hypothetical protein
MCYHKKHAGVAELVDATSSSLVARKSMQVQILPPVQRCNMLQIEKLWNVEWHRWHVGKSCVSAEPKILTDKGWVEATSIARENAIIVQVKPSSLSVEFLGSGIQGKGETLRDIREEPLLTKEKMSRLHCKICGLKACMHGRENFVQDKE